MEVELTDSDLVERIGRGRDLKSEAELFRRMAPRIRLYGCSARMLSATRALRLAPALVRYDCAEFS